VVSAEEVVAHIPSHFTDPERACPASTFYRSAQVHGRLEELTDPAAKARALQALMARFQPEGGHRPLDADDPLHRGEIDGVLVFRVSLDRVDGKAKLGQNRSPDDLRRILAGLWARGHPTDPAAIEAIRAASPATPLPAFLSAPEGVTLHVALPREAAEEAAALLAPTYWWQGAPRELVTRVQLGAQAWVGARDGEGRLLATARAVSDGETAWIYDLVVAPAWRGRGLGRRITDLVLDHPAVRVTRAVRLATRDAQKLYASYGFVDVSQWRRPYAESDMVLVR